MTGQFFFDGVGRRWMSFFGHTKMARQMQWWLFLGGYDIIIQIQCSVESLRTGYKDREWRSALSVATQCSSYG